MNKAQYPKKIDFLSIPVDSLSMEETIDKIDASIKQKQALNHVVINAGKVVAMQTNKDLYDSVINCDIINADGQSIIWAAKFLGKHLPERVAGIDLMDNLIRLAYEKGYKCFFFGAKEEVVSKVVQIYSDKYSKYIIGGYRNGYYSVEEEAEIALQIADSRANLLFVAITSPKKEIFLDKYKDILSPIGYTMGVGGSFDVVAGITKKSTNMDAKSWDRMVLPFDSRTWQNVETISSWKFKIHSANDQREI
ncbi:putative N-acetylmannosaminyltransferase [termite gut metagenome]|uniref:Putative N-acetylmannosaminyltransferase n=1 Tax=termite gut metagenome TaxID=433724 RepID=A0A5J4SFT9_9ZZZZ